MIDSSKAPVPAWKRYATMALLAVLIVVAGYAIYAKEIRKNGSSSSNASAPAATAPAAPSTAPPKAEPSTTVPGGVPLSSRNPFGG